MSRLSELITELCPDGVEYKRIDQVVTIRNGSDHKHLGDGETPVYGSGGIMRYADTASYQGPSVLLPRKGSVDKVYYVDRPFWNVDTVFHTVIDELQVVPKFFYYLMVNAHLEQYSTSAARPSLTQRVLNKIVIPVPPIEVQREVVRILDEYTAAHDELVRQLEQEIHLQAHLRQAMHDEIVEKAIVGNEMISLGNVCQITDGDHQPPPKTELGIPFVTISCIDQRRMIDYSQASFVSDDYYKSLDESRRPLKGDVLLTVVGTLGVPVRVMNESPFVVQRHIAIMRPSKTVDQGFLYHYVSWSKFHSDAVAAATGSAQKTIGLRYLRKAEFPDIPIDEQILVSTQLDRLEHESVELKGRLTDDIELINQQLTLVRNQLLTFPEKVA